MKKLKRGKGGQSAVTEHLKEASGGERGAMCCCADDKTTACNPAQRRDGGGQKSQGGGGKAEVPRQEAATPKLHEAAASGDGTKTPPTRTWLGPAA
jgi:hypothetical protein